MTRIKVLIVLETGDFEPMTYKGESLVEIGPKVTDQFLLAGMVGVAAVQAFDSLAKESVPRQLYPSWMTTAWSAMSWSFPRTKETYEDFDGLHRTHDSILRADIRDVYKRLTGQYNRSAKGPSSVFVRRPIVYGRPGEAKQPSNDPLANRQAGSKEL